MTARSGGFRRGERGSSLVEFTLLGILFLVPLIWLVLAVFDIQRAAYGVAAASREAGRSFVRATSYYEAMERAYDSARFALRDQRIAIADTTFGPPVCQTGGAPGAGCLESGSFARFQIRYHVSLPFVPEFFGGPIGIWVESTHTTPYGEFRQSR